MHAASAARDPPGPDVHEPGAAPPRGGSSTSDRQARSGRSERGGRGRTNGRHSESQRDAAAASEERAAPAHERRRALPGGAGTAAAAFGAGSGPGAERVDADGGALRDVGAGDGHRVRAGRARVDQRADGDGVRRDGLSGALRGGGARGLRHARDGAVPRGPVEGAAPEGVRGPGAGEPGALRPAGRAQRARDVRGLAAGGEPDRPRLLHVQPPRGRPRGARRAHGGARRGGGGRHAPRAG
eukprot:scaffold3729_cov242-Prasinococcus_capsulatus_cf.AAC.1